MHEPPLKAEHGPDLISPYKREAGGSNPPAPTKFLQLDGLFETLIGNPVTTAGNHRCMLPDGGRVPSGHGSIPFDHQGAPCADGSTTGLGAARRADGSAASGLAAARLHRGEPDGWGAPRGSPGDRVGVGRRPGRRSSLGRGAARGPGRRRHQDPEVPPRPSAGADGRRGAQEWQVDQAAGSRAKDPPMYDFHG